MASDVAESTVMATPAVTSGVLRWYALDSGLEASPALSFDASAVSVDQLFVLGVYALCAPAFPLTYSDGANEVPLLSLVVHAWISCPGEWFMGPGLK